MLQDYFILIKKQL